MQWCDNFNVRQMSVTTDQGDQTPRLPAGWAFSPHSIKAHYYQEGHTTAMCGKTTQTNGAQRNPRAAISSDCAQCRAKLEKVKHYD